MKYLKMLGIAAVAAMSFMAFAVSSASATTLEVNGSTVTTQTITASLKSGTKAVLARTDGSLANECAVSHGHGIAETQVDEVAGVKTWTVTGPFTGHTAKQKEEGQKPEDGLSFSSCTRPVTVHDPGTLKVDWTSGTDGTVTSEGADVTVGSPFGTLTCKTGEGTPIGTLTGTDGTPAEHAELDVSAVLNCGFLVPSATWKGTYVVTTPTKLGVEK